MRVCGALVTVLGEQASGRQPEENISGNNAYCSNQQKYYPNATTISVLFDNQNNNSSKNTPE